MVLVAQECASYTIEYQDCRKPNRIQQYDIHQICTNQESKSSVKPQNYKILVPNRNIRTTGYRCEVRKSSYLFYCGAWSHQKLISPPKIDVMEKTTVEGCNSMIHTSKYRIPGQSHTVHVAIGEEATYLIDEIGTIHVSNNIACEGEAMKVGNQIVDSVVEVAQYRLKIVREDYIVEGNRVEAVGDHLKFPESCSIGTGGCITASGTYVWKKPENLCPFLLAKENGEFHTEGDAIVDHKNKLRVKITNNALMTNNCPTGQIYYTDNPDIMLTRTSGYQKVTGADVDVFLALDARSDYLQYSIEKAKNHLEGFVKAKVCDEQYTRSQHDIFPMGEFNGIRRGDTLFLFSCQKHLGKIISSDKCYNSIMIDTPSDQGPLFIDPVTRIASKVGNQVECQQQFPLTIQSKEGWIAISNVIKPIATPQKMFIETAKEEHESMAGTGIYTPEEEKSWESLVSYGSFRDSMIERIARGACREDEDCALVEEDSLPSYDINNLLKTVKEELSIKEKIDHWIQTNVGYLSLAVLILWLLQALISIGIIAQTTAIHGLEAGLAALYGLLCFLPHTINKIRLNAARRSRPTAPIGHNHEMQPLSGTPPPEVLAMRSKEWRDQQAQQAQTTT